MLSKEPRMAEKLPEIQSRSPHGVEKSPDLASVEAQCYDIPPTSKANTPYWVRPVKNTQEKQNL